MSHLHSPHSAQKAHKAHLAHPSRGCAKQFLALCLCLLAVSHAPASDIPPKPTQYFNDYAHVVDPGTAEALNDQLADFERQTSNQIVAAIYPKLLTDDAMDDFCYRAAQAWGVGQKNRNNGAVLFVFVADHKMNIQTGYGLEGALPDITCARIEDDEIAPHFKQGDYSGGMRAGISAMIAAAKHEYKGTGRTVADRAARNSPNGGNWIFTIFILLFIIFSLFRRTRGVVYQSNGIGSFLAWSLLSGGGGGGSFGGGGGSSGGGGGFSSGGGSFGGGGASGSW